MKLSFQSPLPTVKYKIYAWYMKYLEVNFQNGNCHARTSQNSLWISAFLHC